MIHKPGDYREVCAVCGKDVSPIRVPSYSVIEWIPETRSNVLRAMYCEKHKPEAEGETLGPPPAA